MSIDERLIEISDKLREFTHSIEEINRLRHQGRSSGLMTIMKLQESARALKLLEEFKELRQMEKDLEELFETRG